ncbi:MAG TPA: DHA2 family efflux MFS transporter permease subunit [Terriglobales bacterium]|nr:DHA2 family efflux MFS transporter permease subunit [Terriglobales bacterium]
MTTATAESAAMPEAEAPLSALRRWSITVTVMTVTVMQVLDVTVINVALPHMQGSLSAGTDEISWVLTSYLAANAVILPASGWLAGILGRKRFFLLCTVGFTLASVLCGLAPNLNALLLARVLQGIAGGPLMPLSQAIMWEIFPFRQRGMAMAVWGMGIMMAPIFGPTLGGWITDNWSWRWTFYINVPIGILGFFAASAILFDPPYLRKPGKIDVPGLFLMVIGFLSLQLFLDQGERYEWFDSNFIVALGLIAVVALVGFLVRELTAEEPILDLGVYRDRNFAASSLIMVFVMFGFFSSMVLLALFTQKVLGYDAWTSGLVLAPGGVGNLISLVVAGRLINRMDQRILLALGCVLNAWAAWNMSVLTSGVDYWALAWPRFMQGLGVGLIFVPLNAVGLATIPRISMGNATALLNVVRNLGGAAGVAVVSMLLARRTQEHQATLIPHVNPFDAETAARLSAWTSHFGAQGADSFTAQRRALAMVYQEVTRQAQVLAFADDFWLLFILFSGTILLLPLLSRVRTGPATSSSAHADEAPAPVHME